MKADARSGAANADAGEALGLRPGRSRLATVRADFFLDAAERLSERERALMTAMLHCLVTEIAGSLRAHLPGTGHGGVEGDHRLVSALNQASLLDELLLIAMLLRRADEERIAVAATARAGRSEARVLQGLVAHDIGAVSAAAMALILARGRRRDRFGQCLLAFDDLPRPTAELMVHRIAAALKLSDRIADEALLEASAAVIDSHDPAKSVEALADALAIALAEAGALDDDLLLASAHEGDMSLLAHLLGYSADVPGHVAESELLSGDPAAIIALFRMAKVSRQAAAGILAAIGDLLRIFEPASAMRQFDRMSEEDVRSAHILVTSDPAYRSALAQIEANRG